MKYLLDTNILIWFSQNDLRLPEKFREIILNPKNICVVSIISLWEISIKYSLKRLYLGSPLDLFFSEIERTDFIEILNIKQSHLLKQATLPFYHRDPFDRLIFAQAKIEKLKFLYTDDIFDKYEENE